MEVRPIVRWLSKGLAHAGSEDEGRIPDVGELHFYLGSMGAKVTFSPS